MKKKQSILKATKVLPASTEAKKRMEAISQKVGARDLFPEKVRLAKKTLRGIKTLPI